MMRSTKPWFESSVWLILTVMAASSFAQSSVLFNPKKASVTDELVRLRTVISGSAGGIVVRENGMEVPYQAEDLGGKKWIWVCPSFQPNTGNVYEVSEGKPTVFPPKVKVIREDGTYCLDNGIVAVKAPAEAGAGIPLPVRSIRMPDGRWIGGGSWQCRQALRKLTASVIGDGTLFGKIRLRYEFEGQGGVLGDTPAFAEVDVTVGPGWKHIEIVERHAMTRGDNWEFELSRGWSPTNGIARNFDGGLGHPFPVSTRELKPVAHQAYGPDMFLCLLPRWTQNYRDGWAFCAADGQQQAGAVAVRASRWVWPHENKVVAVVKPDGRYAGLRCPTWCGERLWWIVTSPEPANVGYVARYAWEHLDKLNHEMILEWPGKAGSYGGLNFYDNVHINPTSMIRGWNRGALANAGKPGDYGTLAQQQTLTHPDSYGSYWQYWSPNNPNFFSDFYSRAIFLVTNLKDHPRYEDLRRMAVLKAREDIYHSVTLPGGAGQECPGYMSIGHWGRFADVLKTHLGGDDPVLRERLAAAESFRQRISQPDWPVRRRLPIGDTHNARGGDGIPPGPAVEEVPAEMVKTWTATELPGFGVIFNARPGTDKETYLSFKSGPNRGHYHGDQLSFHFCAGARPVAVDHHCSYHPRASQEAMHNRLAFFTDNMQSANMDGYERLIAFKTSPDVDVAVGQVESSRLRYLDPFPPPKWHPEFPQHAFAQPLTYRRTVVFVRGTESDYVVFRDQFWAAEPIHAAFCLHALDPDAFGGTQAVAVASNVLADATRDFVAAGVQPGWTLALLDSWRDGTNWSDGSVYFSAPVIGVSATSLVVRATLPGSGIVRADAHIAQGEVVLSREPMRYRLFKPVARIQPNLFRFNSGLFLYCRAGGTYEPSQFPWEHNNGGRESTQGLRLTMRGVKDGQFISVMNHGARLDISEIDGGIRVGADEILFAGHPGSAGDDAGRLVVRRQGKQIMELTGHEIDLNRSQGETGLCVSDAGYPFGDTPDWLIRQRAAKPGWYDAFKEPGLSR